MPSKKAKPVPEAYHAITPYLSLRNASRAIEFYKKAFGATELMRFALPNGHVGHAELKIGDSIIMLADEHPEMGTRSPETVGGTPTALMLYVDNVDKVVDRAVTEGARIDRPVEDKLYGDRSGTLTDPFGHVWHVSTHVEDVPPDELKRRAEAAMREAK